MAELKRVVVHTDGGCLGNPGPGGWGAVLEFGSEVKELRGGAPATTNNRMELQAAIEALRSLGEPHEVEMFTDSLYLREGITKWISSWKTRGWKTAARKAVKNEDLWRELDALVAKYRVHWRWLKGHAGHPLNERCDRLAAAEIGALRKRYSAAQLAALKEEFLKARGPEEGQMLLLG